MTFYKIVLESEDWCNLNALCTYIDSKTDYEAVPKEYLNVGESMITKLEIFYFNSKEWANEFINLVFAYYGKDKTKTKISFVGVEL